MHTALLCLGSNTDAARHLALARRYIEAHCATVSYSEEITTRAEGAEGWYRNQCARVSTSLTLRELHTLLKDAEHALGRRPEDKPEGRVVIDIDLLCFDHHTLRPRDMGRGYVRQCLATLAAENI